jgi:MFS family permease
MTDSSATSTPNQQKQNFAVFHDESPPHVKLSAPPVLIDPNPLITSTNNDEKKAPLRVLFNSVQLRENITTQNYYSMVFNTFLYGFVLSGTELLQVSLLTDPLNYGYDPITAAGINAALTITDLVTKVLVTPVYGRYMDKYGRQKMLRISYGLCAFAYLLFPCHAYGLPGVFPWYFLARIVYSNGSGMTGVAPLAGDYIDESTLGRGLAINAFANSVGMFVSTFYIRIMVQQLDLVYLYLIGSVFIAGAATWITWGLKPGTEYFKKKEAAPLAPGTPAPKINIGAILKATIKSRPWILIAWACSFMAGCTLSIMTGMVNLFVKSFYLSDEKTGEAIAVEDQLIAQISSVFCYLLFGFIFDKIKSLHMVVFVFTFGIIGYTITLSVTNPDDVFGFFVMCIIGISFSGTQMNGLYLGFVNYPAALRGLLLAISTLFILAGVIFTGIIGGFMFKVSRRIPFILVLTFFIIDAIVIAYIYTKKVLPSDKAKAAAARGETNTPAVAPTGGMDDDSRNRGLSLPLLQNSEERATANETL